MPSAVLEYLFLFLCNSMFYFGKSSSFPPGFLGPDAFVNLFYSFSYPVELSSRFEASGVSLNISSSGLCQLRPYTTSTYVFWVRSVNGIKTCLNSREGYQDDVFFLFVVEKEIEGFFDILHMEVKLTLYDAFVGFYFQEIKMMYFACNFCFVGDNNWKVPILPVEDDLSFVYESWKKQQSKFSKIQAVIEAHSPVDICDNLTCKPTYRFTYLAKRKFNFTLNIASKLQRDFLENTSLPYSLIIGKESYVQFYRYLTNNSGPYIRDREPYHVLYCENGLITTTSSYHHWTSAFDLPTWILILISSLAVSILSSKLKPEEILPQIIQSLGIILREPMGDMSRYSKLDLLMAMSFLCLSLKYESELTGEITVPPPPVVASNLKELLIDKGFNIVFPITNMSTLTYYDLSEFKQGFAKYKLDKIFYSKIQGLDREGVWKKECLANRTNRLGTDAPQSERTIWLLEYGIMAFKNGRFCHIVPEPFFDRLYSTNIKGHGFHRLIAFLHLLREVGLETMWQSGYYWHQFHKKVRSFMRDKDAHKVLAQYLRSEWSEPEPIQLSDKYIQVFVICSFVAGLACLSLTVELILFNVKHSRRNTLVQAVGLEDWNNL